MQSEDKGIRKMIDVSCAIIVDHEAKVLVTQRSAKMKLPLKWEFPGGKVEPDETPQQCLVREIKEELDVDIEILSPMKVNVHYYTDFSIRLIPFICKITSGDIHLKEHAEYRYLSASEFKDLDWAEADIPVYEQYWLRN